MAAKVIPHFRFKLGCDPEMFLSDINGQLKAACGLIGGTKEHPQPIEALGEGYAVQEDNVAVEFNIPPAATSREFVDSITKIIKVLGDGINFSHNLSLDRRVAVRFPKEELLSEQARIFGCDPDFNAWTGQKNPKPKADDETLRSCGGHIHVSTEGRPIAPLRLIKCMDLTLGVPSVLMDTGEGSADRRKLYGAPGAHRIKPYGVEYRVLSSFWIHHPDTIKWAWAGTGKAIELTIDDSFDIDAYKDDIQSVIMRNDKNAALTMVKELGLEVVNV